MNLPGNRKRIIDLENDLPLTTEDFQAMSLIPRDTGRDLADYLAFLEEIGAFETKKTSVRIYSEVFTL